MKRPIISSSPYICDAECVLHAIMSSSPSSLPLLSCAVHEEGKDMNGEHQETSGSAPLGGLAKGVRGGEPIGEAVECPRVRPVVALRELHELRPREVRVQPRAAELPRRRPDHAVLRGAEEEGQRLSLPAPVHHGPVQAAFVPPVGQCLGSQTKTKSKAQKLSEIAGDFTVVIRQCRSVSFCKMTNQTTMLLNLYISCVLSSLF